jgi:ABC-2 type transporter
MDRSPLLCGDEISTGLDAASTFDIVDIMTFYGRMQRTCRVIALLQPSPETVACFDEVLVIAEGKLLFAGPILDVQSYFEQLGYNPPETMDVADFLQILSTPDAASLWKPPEGETERTTAYTVPELAQKFKASEYNKRILEALEAPWEYSWDGEGTQPQKDDPDIAPNMISKLPGIHRKYANSFPRAVRLNLRRALTLWIRDRRVLIANAVKNAVMGLSVGGVFWQTNDTVSILGVLFQSMLFIMLGASTTAPALVDDRVIFRKHYEANFYSAYPFVVGRAIAQMPQIFMDVLVFGSILYVPLRLGHLVAPWSFGSFGFPFPLNRYGMVGLHPSLENYVIFIAILFTFSVSINQLMAVFAAKASTKASVQVLSAVILLFCILFGGFIVPPNVIPHYYIWVYWWNPFAWAYRALLVLEFQSDSWEDGDVILRTTGFVDPNDKPFQTEWVGYWFIYMASTYVFYVFLTAYGLGNFTSSGSNISSGNHDTVKSSATEGNFDEKKVVIPFVPATLTFENICYDVQESTGSDKLRLLNNVDGIFKSGRMCALMGSSGAG